MADQKASNATSAQQDTPSDTPAGSTPAGAANSAEKPAGHSSMPTRLREKGAAATEKVHAGVTHAREIASDKAPAVKGAVQERRGLAIGLAVAVTALGCLLLRRRRGRTRRAHDAVETS